MGPAVARRKPGLVALAAWLVAFGAQAVGYAQSPTGAIAGHLTDRSGADIASAMVRITSVRTGEERSAATGPGGTFTVSSLLPGAYRIEVAAPGFQTVSRRAEVDAGATTTVNFALSVDAIRDSVTVDAVLPQLRHDRSAVGGAVTRDLIDALPLNGRNFLELAKLEPGGQLPSSTNRNRLIVPILGAPASNIGGPRFTIDGGSVSAIGLGGAQLALSQDVVEQFELTSTNFDLAGGFTDAGVVNVISRSGGNTTHGSAVLVFRDHHLAAYPGLARDPANADPFFRRSQYGGTAGGPLRRNRLFYFASWEHSDQEGVSPTTLTGRDFSHLTRITRSPLDGTLVSGRVDARVDNRTSLFVRHSRDSSDAFGPVGSSSGGSLNGYPSNWNHAASRSSQSLVSATRLLRDTIVHDVRASLFTTHSTQDPATAADCGDCLGLGSPLITVAQSGLVLGNSLRTIYRGRRFEVTDAWTWQRGAHLIHTGIDWEHLAEQNLIWSNDPIALTLFSPERVRAFNANPSLTDAQRLPLPASFQTIDDILQLPVQSLSMGIGDPGVPQSDGSETRRWNMLWTYLQDTWRVGARVTLTGGIAWGYDGNLNHDLAKPALLAPVLPGGDLRPTQRNWLNVSPTAGVAWTIGDDGETVVRAGLGRYYRPHGLTSSMDAERVMLGPPGLGRQTFSGASIPNPLVDVPDVGVGTPLEFRSTPTRFTGADALRALSLIQQSLQREIANGDAAATEIEITKQAQPAIFPHTVDNEAAWHVSAGVQRELASHVAVSADFVYRRFIHVPLNGGSIDANRFISSRGPVIPLCTAAMTNDPGALCSRGPINVQLSPFWFSYKGVLVRAERRLTHGVRLLASYALSRNVSTHAGSGFNIDDWTANVGPAGNDQTHVLNLSGVGHMAGGIDVAFNYAYASTPPFTASLGNLDLDGDGTTGDLLPGTTVDTFNRRLHRDDLERLVAAFNDRYANTTDTRGTAIPQLTLPAKYSLGDNYSSLDVRISRPFAVGETARATFIVEAFNVFNTANLSGFAGDLTSPTTFGQPVSRATQIFGSGGPRSLQVGTKLTF